MKNVTWKLVQLVSLLIWTDCDGFAITYPILSSLLQKVYFPIKVVPNLCKHKRAWK